MYYMADKTNLNPEPAANPAAVDNKKTLPKAPAVSAEEATVVAADAWQGGFSAFKTSFTRLKANPEPLYVIMAAYAVLAVVSILVSGETSMLKTEYSGFEDILSLVFLLAVPVYALALADKVKISTKRVFTFDNQRFFMLLGATILTVLIVFASALLLLVPLIWTVAWYSLVSYASVDKKLGVIDSLKESKRLAQNHKSKVWGLIGVGILWYLPVIILAQLPVAGAVYQAFVMVVFAGAAAMLYRWLQHNVPDSEE